MTKNTIVFYDNKDLDGRTSKEIYRNKHPHNTYIGLDRTLNLNTMGVIPMYDGRPDKMFYLDYLMKLSSTDVIIDVVFLDLAPRDKKQMVRLIDIVNSCKIIDHHILPYNPIDFEIAYITYAKNTPNTCATKLTWLHLFPKDEIPYVIHLINDRDVWENELQPFSNYLKNIADMINDKELYDLVFNDNDLELLTKWLTIGGIRQQKLIKEINNVIQNKKLHNFGKIGNYDVVWVEEIDQNIESDILHELCVLYKRIAISISYRDKQYHYTLRSDDKYESALQLIRDNNLTGGGHRNACGFRSNTIIKGLK